jgi:phosphoribosylanthranilate isomerase
MVRVKVCGLTRKEDVTEAARLGADALGFILAPSRREVPIEEAGRLTERLPPFVTTVAVVVDPSEEKLREVIESRFFGAIQFHGSEVPERLRKVPVRTIKAFGLGDGVPENIDGYDCADWFLFDAGRSGQGGTGLSFDWSLLEGKDFGKPFILAGGLGPENLTEALNRTGVAAVDLNSGIEAAPGVKDHERMKLAFMKIRQYERERLERETR